MGSSNNCRVFSIFPFKHFFTNSSGIILYHWCQSFTLNEVMTLGESSRVRYTFYFRCFFSRRCVKYMFNFKVIFSKCFYIIVLNKFCVDNVPMIEFSTGRTAKSISLLFRALKTSSLNVNPLKMNLLFELKFFEILSHAS